MANRRREETREQLNLKSEKQKEKERIAIEKAEQEAKRIEARRQEIEGNSIYRIFISGFSFGLDILDGVLGFVEGVGDFLTTVISFVYVYISLFVVRSFRLTLAVLTITLIDAIIGFIPFVGSIVDLVFCGNYINKNMIKGFVDGNKEARRRVNIISSFSFIVIAFVVALIICIIKQ